MHNNDMIHGDLKPPNFLFVKINFNFQYNKNHISNKFSINPF